MTLEKGSISGLQFSMLLIGFLFGSTVLFGTANDLKQSSWMIPLLGTLAGLVMASIFVTLNQRFPGQTLIEINNIVFGRWLGKLFSCLFLWFLLHLGATVISNFELFFSVILYPATPTVIFGLFIVLVCVYAVVMGLEVLVRCVIILLPFTLITLIFNTITVIPQMKLSSLLPVTDIETKSLLIAAGHSAAFPFWEIVAFLMIIGFVHPEVKKKMPLFTWSFVIFGLYMAFLTARNIMVLGPMETHFVFPGLETVRMTNIADVITRTEAIVAINFMSMGFIKAAVLLYGCSLGGAQLLKLKSYRPLVLPLGLLMAAMSMMLFGNTAETAVFAHNTWWIYAMPFEVGIPLLTLLTAVMLRKRTAPKGENGG